MPNWKNSRNAQARLMSRSGNGNGSNREPRLLEGVLASLPLFRNAPPRQVAEIASYSRVQSVDRGVVISRRGERLPGVIAIGYGLAKLALRRADGEEKVVQFVGPNESFGEPSALLDRPCPVEATALADSLLVVIPPARLLRLAECDPGFARRIVCILAERFLGAISEIESSVQQRGIQRVACYLDSLARPGDTAGLWTVQLPATKTAVASRLGVTKETLSRLLRELIDAGLIAMARRDIVILDRARLERLAGEGRGAAAKRAAPQPAEARPACVSI